MVRLEEVAKKAGKECGNGGLKNGGKIVPSTWLTRGMILAGDTLTQHYSAPPTPNNSDSIYSHHSCKHR